MKNRIVVGKILILVGLSSCTQGDKLPEGILPDSTMRNLIIEFNLTDAAAEFNMGSKEIPNFKPQIYHEKTLKEAGISREIFMNSLRYYADKPQKLTKIYEDAITELSKRQLKK